MLLAANLGVSSDDGPVATLEGVRINKMLTGCVTVRLGEYQNHGNITMVKANVDVHRSIAECGCKSAMLQYSAFTPVFHPRMPGKTRAELLRITGRIGALSSREVLLVTSADNNVHPTHESLLIEFGCAPPD